MKRNIVWTMFFLAMLVMSLAAVAKDNRDRDRDECTWSIASAAGEWGFTWTGTIIIGTSALPAAAVGRSIFDAEGNLSGTLTSSIGGGVSKDMTNGYITMNPDCTGTLTVNITGAVPRTATWDMVIDDNGSESRSIMTSLAIGGQPVKPVVTMIAKKQFPDADEGHCRH